MRSQMNNKQTDRQKKSKKQKKYKRVNEMDKEK